MATDSVPTVVVVTIKPEEQLAVNDRLDGPEELEGASGQRYMCAAIGTKRGPMRIALVRMPLQGNRTAQSVCTNAITDMNPAWILVAGIAGGVPHTDFTLGDVIVSTAILDYSYESRSADGEELNCETLALDPRAKAVTTTLQAILRDIPWSSKAPHIKPPMPSPATIEDSALSDRIRASLQSYNMAPRSSPVAHLANIGSSDRLMKDPAFMARILPIQRLLYCVEMESAGVHEACNGKVPFLAVRGISDIVGVRRDQAWTSYACASAAIATLHIVSSGALLPPRPVTGAPPTPLALMDNASASASAPRMSNAPRSDASTTALKNIVRYGDTDIFPRAFEIGALRDEPAEALRILDELENNFQESFSRFPPSNIVALAQTGHNGYRWASQIDPLYNLLLLKLTLDIAPELELARLPTALQAVFSYRYAPDPESGRLFDDDSNWASFQEAARDHAKQSHFVVRTDIADFYSRIVHRNLQQKIDSFSDNHEAIAKIMAVLGHQFRAGVGLPVGGPASRLLSESYLQSSDHVLTAEGIKFCRYSDDYVIFVDSEREAQHALALFAEVLLDHEGLSLQKLKTRTMRRTEFMRSFNLEPDADLDKMAIAFLRAPIKYDPYSPTADEDYRAICEHVSDYDVLGMLTREIKKSRVHQQLTRKLLHAARFIDDADVNMAALTIADNLGSLMAVFSSVVGLLTHIAPKLADDTQAILENRLMGLLQDADSPLIIDLHRAAAIRLYASIVTDGGQDIIWRQHGDHEKPLVRRECIWALSRLKATPLLERLLPRFGQSSQWERCALISASHALGRVGEDFRRQATPQLSPTERLVAFWCDRRPQNSVFSRDAE